MQSSRLYEQLALWVANHYRSGSRVTCAPFGKPRNGLSNQTYLVQATWHCTAQPGTRRFVLRMGSDGEPIHPLQVGTVGSSVELQCRVMEALQAEGSVSVAPVLSFEADPRWLGSPFFVMQHVDGWVPPDHPGYTQEGAFADAPPRMRREFIVNGLQTLATIHRLDWRRAGLQWLDRCPDGGSRLASQLGLWQQYCAPMDFPLVQRALAWLADRRPADEPPPSLTWGDARPQNMIYDAAFRPLVVMDWEGAAILPAEVDVAYWLISDEMVHERLGVRRLPGTPTREEQLALYQNFLGRPVAAIGYYRVFALMTIAATMYNVFSIMRNQHPDSPFAADPAHNDFSAALERELAARA